MDNHAVTLVVIVRVHLEQRTIYRTENVRVPHHDIDQELLWVHREVALVLALIESLSAEAVDDNAAEGMVCWRMCIDVLRGAKEVSFILVESGIEALDEVIDGVLLELRNLSGSMRRGTPLWLRMS
jgi:hypothetical protein